MGESEKTIDHTSLQHGFFQFTFPHTWKGIIPWVLAAIMLFLSGVTLFVSLDIPDVPPVGESQYVDSLDEIDDDKAVSLGAGWENDGDATFAVIEVIIQEGTLIHGYWTLDSDGENCTDHVEIYDENMLTVMPVNGGENFTIGWSTEMGSEVSYDSRSCPGYDDWYINEGDTIELFIIGIDGEYYMLSVGTEGKELGERTEREDAQRTALGIVILASGLMMITTPTSLSDDIKNLKQRWGNLPFVHGKPGELEPAKGPIREVDENDWVLPPPDYETWPDNPYAPNEEGILIEEHPDVIGTPTPATFTLYSINGIIFIVTALWLASDLTARHSDTEQQMIGFWMKIGIVLFSILWSIFAFRKWKLMHNIIDTPSSRVRSVAVGPAELVGQVRPGPKGTMSVDVGGSSSRRVQGVVHFRWKEEERVCSKDKDGNESCNWVTRRTDKGGCEFILHDGTGGILVDPTSWDKVNMGDSLFTWGTSKWRWTVWVLAAGDPVYCLGRVETRTHDEREEGIDTSIPNSLLVVRGNQDIGMQAHLHRGTELSLIAGLRSTTEAIIVPVVMLLFSAIPFIW
tara:strand:+ start:372 stop:2084 length:1713 start_codon:yes stop_codon:yes gene_type:complete